MSMFKFIDKDGSQVWIRPSDISSIEHANTDAEHVVAIVVGPMVHYYEPDSEEACRTFLFNLFEAMGEQYRYE